MRRNQNRWSNGPLSPSYLPELLLVHWRKLWTLKYPLTCRSTGVVVVLTPWFFSSSTTNMTHAFWLECLMGFQVSTVKNKKKLPPIYFPVALFKSLVVLYSIHTNTLCAAHTHIMLCLDDTHWAIHWKEWRNSIETLTVTQKEEEEGSILVFWYALI